MALDGGTGGCGRHHDRDGTFRVSAAVFVRPPPSLTWCLCVVLLGVVPQTSCPICCFCRVYIYIFALIVRRLAAVHPAVLRRGGGGLARLRRYAWQVCAVGGRREAPESAVCSAIVVGSVVFHNHNDLAATPHRSPVL